MNILVCSSYKSNWHAVRPEAEVYIELAKQGHNITIATQGDADYVARFKKFGIDVVDAYPSNKICFKTISKIKALIKNKSIDICYAYNSKTIPNAAFACIGTKAKLIAYRGTISGLYRYDPTSYLTALHPRVDGVVCVSEAVRQDVLKKVWKKKDQVVTIYKGHDINWYDPTPIPRTELGIPENSKIGICVANSRPSKGVKLLLDAIKEIKDPDFHLVLVGKGMEQLQEYAQSFDKSEYIHFLGFRKDISNLMAMSDFQIQPSISGEGLPKTVIEAMVVSKPSIVSTTGGSPELITNDVNGRVVKAGDRKELQDAILEFLDQDKDLERMGKISRSIMIERFSLERAVSEHKTYFYSLMQGD